MSTSQLCRWFEIPRRTVYHRATKQTPIVRERFAQPIKKMIEKHPSFVYRTVADLRKTKQEHGAVYPPAETLADK